MSGQSIICKLPDDPFLLYVKEVKATYLPEMN